VFPLVFAIAGSCPFRVVAHLVCGSVPARRDSRDSSGKPAPLRRPPCSRWGRRGFMGFLGVGNRIPISGCFIKWFWAGFAAVAAPKNISRVIYIFYIVIRIL